jgi:hypothetical protein
MSTVSQFEIDCALMSGFAYRSSRPDPNKFPVPNGWAEIVGSYKINSSGFEAVSFKNGNQVVISFAGTNNFSDLAADIALGLGNATEQLLQAAEYYMYHVC